jgi:hypothetical protein
MRVEVVAEKPLDELILNVKDIPLLQAANTLPYENATVRLREMGTDEVAPTSRYVLAGNLAMQRTLRATLREVYGIDPIALDRGYTLRVAGSDGNPIEWGLVPPIVEDSIETFRFVNERGDREYDHHLRIHVPLLIDGLHRAFTARKEGLDLNVLYITGTSLPFYAIPHQWEDVHIHERVPEHKKDYRVSEPYALYRDFGVLGCGAPRTIGNG